MNDFLDRKQFFFFICAIFEVDCIDLLTSVIIPPYNTHGFIFPLEFMIPQYLEVKPRFIMQCYRVHIELSIPPYNTHGFIFPLEFTIL